MLENEAPTAPVVRPAPVLCHTMRSSDSDVCTYDDPEGLSQVSILALAQDARGYLWIGTQHGPVRFDGMEWGTPAGLAALGTFDSWALDTAEQDALWVGTNGAGLWRLDAGTVPYRCAATVTRIDGLTDDDIHVLCRDTAHALWVGTHQGLAVVDEGRVTSCWTARQGIPEAGICALCADPAGGVWAGSLHGLLRFEQGLFRGRLTCEDGLPDAAVYALCMDAAGRLWAGTRDGIAILDDGRVCATIQDGLPSPEVRTLCLDGAGHMWAGTARGVVCIDQGQVRGCWTRREGLPSSSVWALLCDHKDRMWVGTERGLALMPQQSAAVRRVVLRGDADSVARSFANDRREQMWIGTAGGLATVAPDGQTEIAPPLLPSVLAQADVWAVHRDGVGRMWVAGRYGGLYCVDAATGATIRHCESANAVRCMADDPEGRLWVGTLGAGLACVDADSGVILHRLTAMQGLPCDHVTSLCLDGGGRLWIGTHSGGLVCIDRQRGAVERILGPAEGLPHRAVSGLALCPDGCLWGTTRGGGLFRVDRGGHVSGVWTMADGLPSDTLVSCAFDDDGALWTGTTRGLTRFLPTTGTCVTLGRPHGLPDELCQQGVLRLDEQGRLWVGTAEGVAVVTPSAVPAAIPPCAVYLTGVRIMGRASELADGLEIEDSDYDLAIDYGAVTFVAAAQVLYRTQLVGLESAWSPPQHHRFARYTNLRPGDYTFRVAARNWGGQWSAPCEWRFRVVRNRAAAELDRAQQRAEAAEAAVRVRNEVLSVVAHDLRAPLTGIVGHADLLQRRLGRAEPPSQDWLRGQVDALRAGAWRMASMVDEITDVMYVQTGRQLALQLGSVDLGAAVYAVAPTLAAGPGQRATVEVDAAPGVVVEGDRPRLERVLQNVLSNAVKYSSTATAVHVAVYPQGDTVIIRVQDHGVGIPAAELPHIFTPYYRASTAEGIAGTGLGLASAKAIVEQHGGQIALESCVGEGTTVTLSLPRRAAELI